MGNDTGRYRIVDPEDEPTGPPFIPTCGFHQKIYSDQSVLKWRVDDQAKELAEQKQETKESMAAMAKEMSDQRAQTAATFEKQNGVLEKISLRQERQGAKLALLVTGAGSVAALTMWLIQTLGSKLIGG